MAIDEAKLNEFIGRAVGDWGGALGALLAFAGDRLGLYKAMADAGPMTPEQLAEKTGTHPRMIKEWLAAQAAGGYVVYAYGKYTLPAEQAFAMANPGSPAYIMGGYQIMASLFQDEQKIVEAFRTGKGLGWGDHNRHLFEGTERFFRPNYVANLVSSWIPSLDGVQEKLERGISVADVGCGHGASTILMAKAFPKSRFTGFDFHRPSVEWAQKQAEQEGVAGNCSFQVAGSTDYPGQYDLIAFFDCFHDMGNPAAAAANTLKALKKDGTWMIVEPFANEKLEENLNPVGRVFYSASSMICVPASLNENGPALGAQASDSQLHEIVRSAGFTRFRRAAQTPFNRVFEARP
jgi:SAM-dependent methyltransferase